MMDLQLLAFVWLAQRAKYLLTPVAVSGDKGDVKTRLEQLDIQIG